MPSVNSKNNNKNNNGKNCKTANDGQVECQQPKKASASSDTRLFEYSRCPHVVLIGNVCKEDLELENLIRINSIHQQQQSSSNDDEEKEADNSLVSIKNKKHTNSNNSHSHGFLKCRDCDSRKNLWVCLRDDCLYVGCGTENQIKHILLHANVC